MNKSFFLSGCIFIFCSCSVFKPKYGCPTNGKNIGAERILSGDKAAVKAARKAKSLIPEKNFADNKQTLKLKIKIRMSYHLTTSYGGTEVVIDDNCGISKFYLIADTLAADLKVTFLNQVDDAETLDWDFKYKSHLLTLHYNIFNGISILPNSTNGGNGENKAVLEVASYLKRKTY